MHPYQGARAALTTQHGKELLLAPAFARLGIELQKVDFNTDSLGTFTGEIERQGSADEVVITKARIGMEISGAPFGIASEGSYGPDPQIPLVNSGIELLAWIDEKSELTIIESLRTFDVQAARKILRRGDDLSEHLSDFAFPSHALIIRSESGSKPLIFKGIQAQLQLDEAVEQCWQESDQIVIENDLRAHLNPTRQQAIMTLAEKLVDRLFQLCHRCGLPGWGAVGVLRGATCEECGTLNENYPVGEIRGCAKCGASEERDLEKKLISAGACLVCNP